MPRGPWIVEKDRRAGEGIARLRDRRALLVGSFDQVRHRVSQLLPNGSPVGLVARQHAARLVRVRAERRSGFPRVGDNARRDDRDHAADSSER